MIQQGLTRGVSSVGNPWGPLTGFKSGSVTEESSNDYMIKHGMLNKEKLRI